MLKTSGIVFKITRYKESSLIMDVFTKEAGLQSFLVNGVYSKSNQRLAAALQLMHMIELVAYYKEHSELHRFKELSRWYPYQQIPQDIRRSAIATFILEICRKSVRTQQILPGLFDYIASVYKQLDQPGPFDPNLHVRFMFELSAYLGFQPNNNRSERFNCFDLANGMFIPESSHKEYVLSPESSTVFSLFLEGQPGSDPHLQLVQRRLLLQQLILYYQLHIDHFGKVRSMEVFQDILG